MSILDLLKSLFMGSTRAPAALQRTSTGPAVDEHPPVSPARTAQLAGHPTFVGGLWDSAKYLPAHPKRVGPTIDPKGIVVHTTDMHPSQWAGLLRNYTTSPGRGECATLALGRDASQGVVQFCPITRNANHAGGLPHGWFQLTNGALLHPNTVTVGIEIHAAGLLQPTGKPGEWRHPDTGLLIPQADVFVDAKGRGWHRVTDYQFGVLKLLLDDLRSAIGEFPEGTKVNPDATYASQGVADYATPSQAGLVGHVSLDPVNRMDPGPQVMEWLGRYLAQTT